MLYLISGDNDEKIVTNFRSVSLIFFRQNEKSERNYNNGKVKEGEEEKRKSRVE